MDNTELRAKVRDITRQLDGNTGGLWEYSLSSDSHGGRPLLALLQRAVLLTGNDAVVLADGTLNDDSGPSGSIVLVTAGRIVRASFSNFTLEHGTPELESLVESVPLSAVTRVRADLATNGSQEDSPWPHSARITLQLDRDIAGEREITIPQSNSAARSQASAIAELAARLPML